MYFKEDTWMMKEIFQLSNRALIRMINHLFRTKYSDTEKVWKEWHEQEASSVCLKIGGANRYEFWMRRLEGCIQIYAEDRGCAFYYENAVQSPVIQIREPQILYFGKGRKEEYSTTLEFPGHERIMLPIHVITLEGYSAQRLEENGLILFLPFLFYCFEQEQGDTEEKQEALKAFIIHDIAGALGKSYQKGDLSCFDTQRLKQLCRHAVWRLSGHERWMQDLEIQRLVLQTLDVDLDFLKRTCRTEFAGSQNK